MMLSKPRLSMTLTAGLLKRYRPDAMLTPQGFAHVGCMIWAIRWCGLLSTSGQSSSVEIPLASIVLHLRRSIVHSGSGTNDLCTGGSNKKDAAMVSMIPP
jgi:hypothetical protein